jgi:hypothetical protein
MCAVTARVNHDEWHARHDVDLGADLPWHRLLTVISCGTIEHLPNPRAALGRWLIVEYFEYVGFGPVSQFRDDKNLYSFPPPARKGWRLAYGRMLHKALNTFGRAMFHPSHVAVGAVLVSDAS